MRVKILTRLKNGPDIINAGTIFEGEKKDLPNFVLYELKQNRGTIEVLSDENPKKKKAVKKLSAEPNTLREKLTKTEK